MGKASTESLSTKLGKNIFYPFIYEVSLRDIFSCKFSCRYEGPFIHRMFSHLFIKKFHGRQIPVNGTTGPMGKRLLAAVIIKGLSTLACFSRGRY